MNQPAPLVYETTINHFAEVVKASEKVGYLTALKDLVLLLEVKIGKSKSKIEIRAYEEVLELVRSMNA